MRLPWLFLAALVIAALVPVSAAPAPASHRTVSITPFVNWAAGPGCPGGTKDLETRQVPLPHPGEPVTETWTGEYPSCNGGVSWGSRPNPALPANVTRSEAVTGENGGPVVCPRSDQPCRYTHAVTLTAEPFCQCTGIRVAIRRTGLTVGRPDPAGLTHLKLRLQWTISCAGGRTGECRGEVTLEPSPLKDLIPRTPDYGRVSCKGDCNRAGGASTATGTRLYEFTSKTSLALKNRGNRLFPFIVRPACLGGLPGEPAKRLPTKFLTLAFGPRGLIDFRKSDLNGDGKPG